MATHKKKVNRSINEHITSNNIIDKYGSFIKAEFTLSGKKFRVVMSTTSGTSVWDTVDVIKNIKSEEYITRKRRFLYNDILEAKKKEDEQNRTNNKSSRESGKEQKENGVERSQENGKTLFD